MTGLVAFLFAFASLAAPLHAQESGTVTVALGASGQDEWVVADDASGWSQSQDGRYLMTISASPVEDPSAGMPLYGHLALRFAIAMGAAPEDLVVEGVPGRYLATVDEGGLLIRIDGIRATGNTEDRVLLEGYFSATAELKEPLGSATAGDPLPVEGTFSVSLEHRDIEN